MKFIAHRKNNLWVDNLVARKLAKKYSTPFYCYSLSQLKSNYFYLNNTFKKIKPLVCFSVKSNSNINILRELKKMGSGADVVSIGELLKAINAGIDLFLICHDLSKVTQIQNALIMGIETGEIPTKTIDRSFEKILKAKQILPSLAERKINLNEILEENKKLAEEMTAHLTR